MRDKISELTDYSSNLFASFWMAGFECSDQLNAKGDRVDLLTATGHITNIYKDYERLYNFGISTVREGIRWSKVEVSPYTYNFETVKYMADAGRQCGIQQIWDLCHFGYPDDLSPLHPHFTKRFTALCKAFITFYKTCYPDDPVIVTPINEVSFISWLGGENASTTPFCKNMGWTVKYALVQAYINGIDAFRQIDPNIRILTTEPIVNIVPPLNASQEEVAEALRQHELQYQVLDMLSGAICPELGGKPENLDLLGFNYYYNNQWICGFEHFLPWANLIPDHRWRGLSSLLDEAYQRYRKPIVLSETSHPGADRPNWITHITQECNKVIEMGVPLKGICIYPIIDRPDWDDPDNWHHSGLWDTDEMHADSRLLYEPYAKALFHCRSVLDQEKSQRRVFHTSTYLR